ncbi:hypothetical protein V6N13_117049 [Hibiscus sabdariffa]
MRALLWSKAAVKASFSNEVEWWTNPSGCLFSEAPTNSSLDPCPVFHVSGPVSCNEFIGVDIAAVKAALEVLKLVGFELLCVLAQVAVGCHAD